MTAPPAGLRALQVDFRDRVLNGADTFATRVRETPRLDREGRVAIYANAYAARLIQALGKAYPHWLTFAGAAEFDVVAEAYVRAHPSRYANLRWYGATLADYLAATAPWSRQPWLAEIARFEWALGLAFDADDAAPWTFAALAARGAALVDSRFTLDPSLQTLALAWNVADIFGERNPEEPVQAFAPAAAPGRWVVWRQQLAARFRALPDDEARALAAAMQGGTFADVALRSRNAGCRTRRPRGPRKSSRFGWRAAGLPAARPADQTASRLIGAYGLGGDAGAAGMTSVRAGAEVEPPDDGDVA